MAIDLRPTGPHGTMLNQGPLRELEKEVKQRREAQRTLGKTIDALLTQSAAEDVRPNGCFAILGAV